MVTSSLHEALVRLFRDRPKLAPDLLRGLLDVVLPSYTEVRTESPDFAQSAAAGYFADFAISLVSGQAVMGVIVEVQLRSDPQKRLSWPVYVASMRARLNCPVCLLVVTPHRKVAAWAKTPIELGPGGRLQPIVLGPDMIPAIADIELAQQDPELAVLSAMAHGPRDKDPELSAQVAFAALHGCLRLDDEPAALYADMVRSSLGEAARVALEKMMQSARYEFQSEFARKYVALGRDEGKAEGMAKGKAEGILRVLARRGIPASDEQRARVLGCSDLEQLDAWLDLAVTAASADELFA